MFEAFKIGITLSCVNLVSPQLALLAKEFEKLDALTISLQKSLKKISVDSTGLRALTTATNATNRAFEKANISAAAFEARLASINRASAGAAMMGRGGGGGIRPAGMHGGNIHVGPGGVGLGTMGFAAGAGYMPLLAAGAAAYGGKALYESAKNLNTEQNKFRLFGMNEAQNQDAFRFAHSMRVYGMSETENMRNFREAQGIFREAGLPDLDALKGAKLAAPILSKLNALDSSLDDEGAARSAASNLAMLKWVESAGGLKSQSEFNRLANLGYKLKVSSGDTVDWAQLQQFQRRGGSAAINIGNEGMAKIEPAISTLGGSTVGVGLATGFGRLEGIVRNLPVPVIDELLKYGVWDKSKVQLNSHGGLAKVDSHGPMSVENTKLLTEDPEGFYEKIIRPIYAKMGLDAAGVIRQNALIYGRTGGALANEWEKQLATIARASAAYNKTMDPNQATAQLPASLAGQEKEFSAAWIDFKTQFGTTMLPLFTAILKTGASILRPDQNGSSPIGNALHTATQNIPGASLIDWVSKAVSSGESRYVSGRMGGHDVKVVVTADARKLGIAVTTEQMKASSMPQTGINTFNDLMGLRAPGQY